MYFDNKNSASKHSVTLYYITCFSKSSISDPAVIVWKKKRYIRSEYSSNWNPIWNWIFETWRESISEPGAPITNHIWSGTRIQSVYSAIVIIIPGNWHLIKLYPAKWYDWLILAHIFIRKCIVSFLLFVMYVTLL